MDLPPPRPLADRVEPVDAHLERFSPVLRLAAARFLSVHGDIVEAYVEATGDLPRGSDDLETAAAVVLSEFAAHRDVLTAEAAKACAFLDVSGDVELSLYVTEEICSTLVTVDMSERLAG